MNLDLASTLAVRAEDLARIGGFESVASYLADDYQLGRRIHALGLHCVLSDVVVETHLAGRKLAGGMEPPGPVGADDSRVARARLCGAVHHVRERLGGVRGDWRVTRTWRSD